MTSCHIWAQKYSFLYLQSYKANWNAYFQVFFDLINTGVEINKNHTQDDKSHPHGCDRIGHLAVFDGGKYVDQNQAYSGPNGIGHGNWNLF